ncbi:MAG: hypothetical protein Q9195_004134 [Heterodermia aff. obscurata]
MDTKYNQAPTEPPPSYEPPSSAIQQPVVSSKPPPQLRPPLPLNLPILNELRSKRVVLASASPRRKQLLAQIGLSNLEIHPSTLPENFPKTLSPFEYVLRTATQKCMHVYGNTIDTPSPLGEPALVLAADTVVVAPSGQILEKPGSEAQHIAMLTSLRNCKTHKVYTAVVAMAPLVSARDPGYALESTVEETTVWFAGDVSDEMILAYVRTREGADKAGGYAVQGVGALLVEKIEGGWDNAIGLPLRGTLTVAERVMEKGAEEAVEDEFAEAEE